MAHHGWIPEAVYTTASILPGRKSKSYEHEKFGSFTFYPLAIEKGHFLELVIRQKVGEQTMLIAKPIRALMDLVCLRTQEWQGIDWFIDGLRIDKEYLSTVTRVEIRTLKLIYKQKRVKKFLEELSRELGHD